MAKSFRNSKWYNIFLLSILAIILAWQLYGGAKELFIITTGEQATAVVQVPTCNIHRMHCRKRVSLKIQYSTPDGSMHVFEEFGGFIPYYRVGENVKVYYLKNNPGQATIFSMFSVIRPLLMIMLLLLTGLGMKAMLRERK